MQHTTKLIVVGTLLCVEQGCSERPTLSGPSSEGYTLKQAWVGETYGWVHALSRESLELEIFREGGDPERVASVEADESGGFHWRVPGLATDDRLRIVADGAPGVWFRPKAVEAVHQWPSGLTFWNDEEVPLAVGQLGPGISAWFGLMSSNGHFEPVDVACLASGQLSDCRSSSAPSVNGETVSLFMGSQVPRWWELAVAYGPVDEDGELLWEQGYLSVDTHRVISLGAEVLWGDLHGHTNLSLDGCEHVEEYCQTREEEPGLTFFDEAIANGLDFAAITDHAELEYWETPATMGELRSIWETQSERASAAEASGFMALLGYEWTRGTGTNVTDADGYYINGHKTVVLEDTRSHSDWRIGAKERDDRIYEGSGENYIGANPLIGPTPSGLYDYLDAAKEQHGAQEVLVFAHHPALLWPQATDWRQADNTALDDRYETLVEIHSEHGSSECFDRSLEHCDYGYSDNRGHFPYGSVQYALMTGLRLGLVGGTDSHDSRPGSLADGGGAHRDSSETMSIHPYDGALTGVWVREPTKAALFSGLRNRHTVVTTGPMLEVRAALINSEDAVVLPGSSVEAGEVRVVVEVPDWPEGVIEGIELVQPDNSIVASSAESVLDVTVELEPNAVVYTRIRFDQDGKHQRYWLSPWFFDASP